MVFCSNCGQQISDNANFCANCGARNGEGPLPQSQYTHTQPPAYQFQGTVQVTPAQKPPKKKAKTFAVLALILCACLLVVFLVKHFIKSDEQLINDRIDAFLTAYNSGDMEGVISCLDAKTRNKYKSVMNIGNALIGSSGFGIGISDLFGLSVGTVSDEDLLSVTDRSITFESDTTATVTVTLTYKDIYRNMSDSAVFIMVKEDDDWFIKNLKDK